MAIRFVLLVLATVLLAACSPPQSNSSGRSSATKVTAQPAEPRAPLNSAERALQAEVQRLGDGFDGAIGIAVRDVQTGWAAHFNGTEYFPQQSVSKLWVALAALEQVDRGELDLAREVTLRRNDLTVFYQPIRPLILREEDGYTTTVQDLLLRAITRSDNTANDYLMRLAGGPGAVRRTLAGKGLGGIRFGPGERALQSGIAGLEWKPEYSLGRAFYEARDQLDPQERRRAFEQYLADPVDGATPLALVEALGRLQQGKLLSAESTELLIGTMEQVRSGQRRLKGGVPPGWSVAHKTGTGQELEGTQAGYNDVGILASPAGRSYAIAVLMGRASQPLPQRMALMQQVVSATVEYDKAAAGDTASPASPGKPSAQ